MPIEHPPPTETTKRELFAHALRCAYQPCDKPLYRIDEQTGTRILNSEVCHINARRQNGPRWDAQQSPRENQSFDNLVLMCKEHHATIDDFKTVSIYTPHLLRQWKMAQEEEWQRALLSSLTAGLPKIPSPCATHVERFLTNYLGTAQQRVPFGGREAVLEALNGWLDDPAQPPYRLLTGQAGRGKSALLAHWVSRLTQRDDVKIVYFPISQRFQTSQENVILQAVASRLAHAFGEQPPAGLQDSPMVWREVVASYLGRSLPEGRTLLVVLDGLDEADTWATDKGLFPHALPSRLRVVVAVRGQAGAVDPWLYRLGWDWHRLHVVVEEVPCLTQDVLPEVLERMGCPLDSLATDIDVVAALYRLSEGDPLLVGLYVEDLWRPGDAAVRLEPEDLASIPSGLKGYFDRWWEEQGTDPLAEARSRAVLGVLACALGPLLADELLTLLLPDLRLSRRDLLAAFKPLGRFVVGDGTAQGWILAHPRFGGYLRDEALHPEERDDIDGRFLAWGERVVRALAAGTLAPADVPAYLLRHLGGHLERATASADRFLALITEPWATACDRLDGCYQGFLGDVDRAWAAAQREDMAAIQSGQVPPHLGGEVLCALCRSSIATLSGNIPPKLLAELFNDGLWSQTQAMAYVRQMGNDERRQQAIGALSDAAGPGLVNELLAIGRDITDPRQRAMALEALVDRLGDRSRKHVAEEIAAAWEAEGCSVLPGRVLDVVWPHLDDTRRTELLVKARSVKDTKDRGRALASIAKHDPTIFVEAWTEAKGAKDIWTLATLLNHAPDAGVASHMNDILGRLDATGDELFERHIFVHAAGAIAATGDPAAWNHLLHIAGKIQYESDRIEAYTILLGLNQEGPWQNLFNLLHERPGGDEAAWALIDLAPRIPGDYLDTAIRCAQNLAGHHKRIKALLTLAKRGYPALVEEALASVPGLPVAESRSRCLGELIPDAPDHLLDQCHRIASDIREPEYRARALIPLAVRRPEQVVPEVLAAAERIDEYEKWCDVLCALADSFPLPWREGMSLQVVDSIIAAPPFQSQSAALAFLADKVLIEEKHRVLLAALSAGMVIADRKTFQDACVNLIRSLPADKLDSALDFARGLKDPYTRAAALTRLCDHRPTELLDETWKAIQQLDNVPARRNFIGSLLRHAPESLRAEMLDAAHDSFDRIAHPINKTLEFCRFAEYIPESRLEEARNRVLRQGRGDYSALEGAALAHRVPEPEKSALVADVLRIREECKDEPAGCWIVAKLPKPVPADILRDAIERAQRLVKPQDRLAALVPLQEDLPADLRQAVMEEVIASAEALPDGRHCERLAALVDAFPPHLLKRALQVVLEAYHDEDRIKTLWRLSQRLATLPGVELYPLWFHALRHMSGEHRATFVEAVAALAPMGEALGGRVAVGQIWDRLRTVARWWP